MNADLLTLVSVVINALVAILAPVVARKLAAQRENLRRTEETCELLSEGIQTIERAVEENKDLLSRTGAGNRIARTIRAYGPALKNLVDAARMAAHRFLEEPDATDSMDHEEEES